MNNVAPRFEKQPCPLTGEPVDVMFVMTEAVGEESHKSPPHCQNAVCPWLNTRKCPLEK